MGLHNYIIFWGVHFWVNILITIEIFAHLSNALLELIDIIAGVVSVVWRQVLVFKPVAWSVLFPLHYDPAEKIPRFRKYGISVP